jgi:hypothetical protein
MSAFIHERLSGSMLQIRATRAATHRSFFRAKRPDTRVARHYPAPSTAAASVCTRHTVRFCPSCPPPSAVRPVGLFFGCAGPEFVLVPRCYAVPRRQPQFDRPDSVIQRRSRRRMGPLSAVQSKGPQASRGTVGVRLKYWQPAAPAVQGTFCPFPLYLAACGYWDSHFRGATVSAD